MSAVPTNSYSLNRRIVEHLLRLYHDGKDHAQLNEWAQSMGIPEAELDAAVEEMEGGGWLRIVGLSRLASLTAAGIERAEGEGLISSGVVQKAQSDRGLFLHVLHTLQKGDEGVFVHEMLPHLGVDETRAHWIANFLRDRGDLEFGSTMTLRVSLTTLGRRPR